MAILETSSCPTWRWFMDMEFDRSLDPHFLAGLRVTFAGLLSELVEQDPSLDPGLPEDPKGREFVADCVIYSALVRLQGKSKAGIAGALSEVIRSSWDSPRGPEPWLAGFCKMWEWRLSGSRAPLRVRVWCDGDGPVKVGFRPWYGVRVADDYIREPAVRERASGS